jgi:hypothetical protein
MRLRHGLRYCTLAQWLGIRLFAVGVLHGNLKQNFVDNDHRISCNTAGTTTTCRGSLLTSAQIQTTPLKKKSQQFLHFEHKFAIKV